VSKPSIQFPVHQTTKKNESKVNFNLHLEDCQLKDTQSKEIT